ncbi:MAG TPA: GNAT family N-acetyltransferase [Acidimicrobiales bacterium]
MISHAPAAVRTADRDDLQAVLDVHARQGGRPAGPPSRLERDTWDRMMAMAELSVYVAEVDDAVVGTATAMTMPNVTYDCAPTVFVEAVVVLPEHRRRGIARSMMQAILADARSGGCNKVQLLSHKRHAHDGAHRLYTSMGFEPEAEGFRLYLGQRPRRAAPGLP